MAEYTIKTGTLANGDSLGISSPRKIARDSSGNLYVTYHRSDGTRNQIYCSKSIDNGQNWTETKVTNDGIAHWQPSIAIDSANRIFIICCGVVSTYYVPQCTKSIDGGANWSATVQIMTGTKHFDNPCVAIDSSDTLHVISRYNEYQLYYKYSVDQGANWSTIVELSSNSEQFAIAIDKDDNIHVVFMVAFALKYQVNYITSIDGGINWSAITKITSEDTNKYQPSIACDSSGNIHIVYEDVISTYSQIRYTVYTDSWSAPINLTTGNYHHYRPTIAIDASDIITVFFYGFHAGSTTYRQIGYNIYDGSWGGMTWLSSDNAQHRYPNLIWASFPLIGVQRTNRTKTGYFLIFAEEAIIKCEVSANLTWDVAVAPIKVFVDSGSGADSTLMDKILLTLDTGKGLDVFKTNFIIFTDVGEGTDISEALKGLMDFTDSGKGTDQYSKLQELIFSDLGKGTDKLLKDWIPLFTDLGSGIDVYYRVWHYPTNLKRIIILIRDRK